MKDSSQVDNFIILCAHCAQADFDSIKEKLVAQGVQITKTLSLINGLVCTLPEVRVQEVMDMEGVSWIVQDAKVSLAYPSRSKLTKRIIEYIPWGIRKIGAPKAWSFSTGKGVRVGLLDTGVDLNHPDLVRNLTTGINLLAEGNLPEDDNGHGTHVAGIIAGAKNGRGVVGVAPDAKIVPIKAFDDQGESKLSIIIEGIQWAVENGVQVLNMSFGTSDSSLAMLRGVNIALRRGVVMFAASGNDPDRLIVHYPARYRGILGVGASDQGDSVASFSTGGIGLNLVAPGVDITSTWLEGSYENLSGTSMATAHVSGAAALILANQPGLAPVQVYDLLLEAADPLEGTATSRQGAGRLNLFGIFG